MSFAELVEEDVLLSVVSRLKKSLVAAWRWLSMQLLVSFSKLLWLVCGNGAKITFEWKVSFSVNPFLPIQLSSNIIFVSFSISRMVLLAKEEVKSLWEVFWSRWLERVFLNERLKELLHTSFAHKFFKVVHQLETFLILYLRLCRIWQFSTHVLVELGETAGNVISDGCLKAERAN